MNTFLVLLIIFSILSTTLTIVMVIKKLRAHTNKLSQRKAILASGTSAEAVIHSIQQTNAQLNDQPEVLLDLTITKQNGEVIRTELKTVIPIVHIPAFQKGNTIEVKYMTIDSEEKFEVVGAYVP